MDKKLLVVANWKSNKKITDAIDWLKAFEKQINEVNLSNIQVIVCPSFTALSAVSSYVKQQNLPISIGAQDVSGFDQGAYTGEVAASMIAEFATHCIIGHSERRKNFCETDYTVVRKVEAAKRNNLKSIVCLQDENTPIPERADILAYEPIFAIGTGKPDTRDNISKVFEIIYPKAAGKLLLYGGSVDIGNIGQFASVDKLSGFLIATASLDSNNFVELLQKC